MPFDDDADEHLVLRAQRKDASAFAELIARHEGSALGIAYATCGNATTASDVVQDSFMRAWERLDDLKEPHRFAGWLGRIVRNLSTDAIRRGRRRVESLDDRADAVASDGRTQRDARRSDVHGPHADLDKAETRRQIDAALDTLDELTRSAVVLRYFDDLSSKQIGALLELSPAAVDMRLSRARSQLRQVLGPMLTTDHDVPASARDPLPTVAGM